MTDNPSPDARDEAFWHEFLTRGDSRERRARLVLRRLPSGPRCRLCAAPFAGPGSVLMRPIGKRRSEQNPTMCRSCFEFVADHHGGAEIECTMLFADIRGSTTLAEGQSAAGFRALLDRFYTVATGVVFDHDGTVDKFVGDELVALFFPLLSGDRPRSRGSAPPTPCSSRPAMPIPAGRGSRSAPESTRPRPGSVRSVTAAASSSRRSGTR
jgi:hypothetical protein